VLVKQRPGPELPRTKLIVNADNSGLQVMTPRPASPLDEHWKKTQRPTMPTANDTARSRCPIIPHVWLDPLRDVPGQVDHPRLA